MVLRVRSEEEAPSVYRPARASRRLPLRCGFTIAIFLGSAGPQADASTTCADLAKALPPLGISLPNRRLADLMVGNPAGDVRLDLKSVDGLSMASTYGGSLNCQLNKVFKATRSGRSELSIPDTFAGGEAALCAGDKVRFGSIDGAPMLLDELPEEGRVVLTATRWASGGWTPPCTVTLDQAPRYEISAQDCFAMDCTAVARLAVEMADRLGAWRPTGGDITTTTRVHHGRVNIDCSGPGCPPSWEDAFLEVASQKTLTSSQRSRFKELLQTAEKDEVDVEPFQDPATADHPTGRDYYYDSSFFPFVSGEDVLLGKIGYEAGTGSTATPTVLFSVLRLEDQKLSVIAAFRLDITRYVLSAARESDVR